MPRMPSRPGPRTLLRAIGRRWPTTRGVLRVDGLRAQVTVARDRWGIPHIEASDDADAWFALGFCHGQDRAFQLELLARAGRGRLSELLGDGALEIDRLSRTLGFARVAASQAPLLEPDVRAGVDAYVRGINASIATERRPHELVLLRAQRSTWAAEDVLAFLGLQSFALAGNWDTELARLRILLADGPDALARVDTFVAASHPVTVPVGGAAGEPLGRLATDLERLRNLVGGAGASNAWAVAATRTTSGAPILANDPHLAPGIPAPWYLAHVSTPEWSVAGASFVGGPAFPTGMNGSVAWGITAACTDASDLFWESIDPVAGTARGPAGNEPITRIDERITVRGGAEVTETVTITARGPIISALLDERDIALSLRATWLEAAPVRGFLGVHRATDFESFRAGFESWPGPGLNVVYADAAGHIGWQVVGTLPQRHGSNGTLPQPAWSADAAWDVEHLAFSAMPSVLDPDDGFVASANNAPVVDRDDGPFLGVDWLEGYRAARIVERLGARVDWDVDATAELQVDQAAVPWRDLRDVILDVGRADAGTDADAALGRALLESWDGVVSADSAAAAVYELVVAALAGSTAQRGAPRSWRSALGAGVGPAIARTTFGARTLSRLVRDLPLASDRSALVHDALRLAVTTLRERLGPDAGAWSWGRARPLRLLHPLAARRPLDRLLNVGPVPLGGDTNTVAQAGVQPLDPLGNPAAIANHRTVIDLADPERSRFGIAGGQSGNPTSPHYDDLFALWRRGSGVPIAWSHDAVVAATVDRLLLRPRA